MSRRAAVASVASFVVLLCSGSAGAATFEVTRTSDPVPGDCRPRDCSLREAIDAANARSGRDQVVLPRRALYELTRTAPGFEDENLHGDLDVLGRLVIVHPGRGRATIDANGFDRVLQIVSGKTKLRGIALTGGQAASGDGGGVLAEAPLTVLRSRIAGNETVGQDAGGIKAHGTLVVKGSQIVGNDADQAGGAIFAVEADVTVRGSRIAGNRAQNNGGGINFATTGDDRLLISRSTIHGNRSEGAGGGLQGIGGEIAISASTFSRNQARGPSGSGGGMYFDGPTVNVVNSTVEGNRADSFGGGIHAQDGADVALNAVTVARNKASADDLGLTLFRGGGLYRLASVGFSVRNSLIALNTNGGGGGSPNDCASDSEFESLGHNLLSTAFACDGFGEASDLVRANPRIGKLARNGGPTKTVALRKGSPAIGKAHRGSAPNRDQRGRKRDRRPDIGAYERGA